MPKTARRAISFSIAVFLSAFLFIGIADCKSETRIILVKGEPSIMKDGSPDWGQCKKGAVVDNGDRIKTSKDEAVEISFSDESTRVIRIGENSDVVISKCESPYSIKLLDGEIMTLLEKLSNGSTFEIKTPTATCGARGTGWSVTANELKTIFKSFENSIYVKGIDASGNETGELIVRDGWQVIVDKFEKPSELERLAAGDFEKWLEWKNDLMERLEGLKEGGFEAAGAMQNKIQELEDRKNSDVSDTRDSGTINQREGSGGGGSGSGGRQELKGT